MTDLKILYHGEARLADWGETRAGGKYIKLYLSDHNEDPLMNFRGLDTTTLKKAGHNFNITISQGDIISEDPPQKKPFGKLAGNLYSSGFFLAPKVLQAIGTDEAYREWIQRQPSAHSKDFSEWIYGDGRCIAAHVRRAGEAGTAYKPPYSCIPLTNEEHQLQHQQGETALNPQDWWERMKNKYLYEWGKQTLSQRLGYKSMGYVPPTILKKWCTDNELTQYLPRVYRET